MSRIGNNPISIPEGVNIDIQADKIVVKGKMGELTQHYSDVSFKLHENTLTVKRPSDSKDHRAKHGLYRSEKGTIIEDNMTFSTGNVILDLLLYPVLLFSFLPRVWQYKNYFRH